MRPLTALLLWVATTANPRAHPEIEAGLTRLNALIAADPHLLAPAHATLRTLLRERFREPLEMALAG